MSLIVEGGLGRRAVAEPLRSPHASDLGLDRRRLVSRLRAARVTPGVLATQTRCAERRRRSSGDFLSHIFRLSDGRDPIKPAGLTDDETLLSRVSG